MLKNIKKKKYLGKKLCSGNVYFTDNLTVVFIHMYGVFCVISILSTLFHS